jgi:hypothetical protein
MGRSSGALEYTRTSFLSSTAAWSKAPGRPDSSTSPPTEGTGSRRNDGALLLPDAGHGTRAHRVFERRQLRRHSDVVRLHDPERRNTDLVRVSEQTNRLPRGIVRRASDEVVPVRALPTGSVANHGGGQRFKIGRVGDERL